MIIDNRVKQNVTTNTQTNLLTLTTVAGFKDFSESHALHSIFKCVLKDGDDYQIVLAELTSANAMRVKWVLFDSTTQTNSGLDWFNLSGSAVVYQDILAQSAAPFAPEQAGRIGIMCLSQSNGITGGGAINEDGFSSQIKSFRRTKWINGIDQGTDFPEYNTYENITWPVDNGNKPSYYDKIKFVAKYVSLWPYLAQLMITKYQIQEDVVLLTRGASGTTFNYKPTAAGGIGSIGWGIHPSNYRNNLWVEAMETAQAFLSENPLNRIVMFNWIQGVTEMFNPGDAPDPAWAEGFDRQLADFRMTNQATLPLFHEAYPGNYLQPSGTSNSWLQTVPWVVGTTAAAVSEETEYGAMVQRDIIQTPARANNEYTWSVTNLDNKITTQEQGKDPDGRVIVGTEYVHIPGKDMRDIMAPAQVFGFDHARFNDGTNVLRPQKLNNVTACPSDAEIIMVTDPGVIHEKLALRYETRVRASDPTLTPDEGWGDILAHTSTTTTTDIDAIDSGTGTAAPTNYELEDPSKLNFLTTVSAGDRVHNTSTGERTRVASVIDDSTLSLEDSIMFPSHDYAIGGDGLAPTRNNVISLSITDSTTSVALVNGTTYDVQIRVVGGQTGSENPGVWHTTIGVTPRDPVILGEFSCVAPAGEPALPAKTIVNTIITVWPENTGTRTLKSIKSWSSAGTYGMYELGDAGDGGAFFRGNSSDVALLSTNTTFTPKSSWTPEDEYTAIYIIIPSDGHDNVALCGEWSQQTNAINTLWRQQRDNVTQIKDGLFEQWTGFGFRVRNSVEMTDEETPFADDGSITHYDSTDTAHNQSFSGDFKMQWVAYTKNRTDDEAKVVWGKGNTIQTSAFSDKINDIGDTDTPYQYFIGCRVDNGVFNARYKGTILHAGFYSEILTNEEILGRVAKFATLDNT